MTKAVVAENRHGLALWSELVETGPGLFRETLVSSDADMPILFTSEESALAEFAYESGFDVNVEWLDFSDIAQTCGPLSRTLPFGFRVPALAFYAKSLCDRLIEQLSPGTAFHWDTVVNTNDLPAGIDAVIWATPWAPGLGSVTHGPSVGGVLGVWLETDGDVIPRAFKVLGPEPVNYVNVTSGRGKVVASGGYAYVGTGHPANTAATVDELVGRLRETVAAQLPFIDWSTAVSRFCIRPATPEGRALASERVAASVLHVVVGANSAGGFTQAPVQSAWAAGAINRHLT